MNTGLQRMLPRDVFGRAHGLAVPASIGVIGAGSLLAPVLDSALGRTGALLACAAAVLAYTAFLALSTRHPAPAAQLRSPAPCNSRRRLSRSARRSRSGRSGAPTKNCAT